MQQQQRCDAQAVQRMNPMADVNAGRLAEVNQYGWNWRIDGENFDGFFCVDGHGGPAEWGFAIAILDGKHEGTFGMLCQCRHTDGNEYVTHPRYYPTLQAAVKGAVRLCKTLQVVPGGDFLGWFPWNAQWPMSAWIQGA